MSVESLSALAQLDPEVMPPEQKVKALIYSNPIDLIAGAAHIDPETIEQYREQTEMQLAAGRVAIRMPIEAFPLFIHDGRYKTAHETERSRGHGGSVSGDYRQTRAYWEERVYGQGDSDTPIVYGFLEDATTLTSRQQGSRGTYGDVELILRPEVGKRTTFTIGDSLGRGYGMMNYDDAILARQAIDSQKQAGKDQHSFSYIEAQIFGGVNIDDVELIAIDVTNFETTMKLVEEIHAKYEHMPVLLRIPATTGFLGRQVLEVAKDYPYVHFVGEIKSKSPFQVRNNAAQAPEALRDIYDQFSEQAVESYEHAKTRLEFLKAKSAEVWQVMHPGEPFPANVSFDILTEDY